MPPDPIRLAGRLEDIAKETLAIIEGDTSPEAERLRRDARELLEAAARVELEGTDPTPEAS